MLGSHIYYTVLLIQIVKIGPQNSARPQFSIEQLQ